MGNATHNLRGFGSPTRATFRDVTGPIHYQVGYIGLCGTKLPTARLVRAYSVAVADVTCRRCRQRIREAGK